MNELESILDILRESVNTDLNAVLSPRECRLLLAFLNLPPVGIRQNSGVVDRIIKKMTETLEEAALMAIDDMKRR